VSHDRVRLEEYLQSVDWRCVGCYHSIHHSVTVTRNHENETRLLSVSVLMESRVVAVNLVRRYAGCLSYIPRLTTDCANEGNTENLGWMVCPVDAGFSECCTRYVLHTVVTHDHTMA